LKIATNDNQIIQKIILILFVVELYNRLILRNRSTKWNMNVKKRLANSNAKA